MNYWFTYLAKSIYAALVAISSGVIIALRNEGSGIGPYEWLVIALAGAVAGVGVFALPPAVDPPSVQRAKAEQREAATSPTPTQPQPTQEPGV